MRSGLIVISYVTLLLALGILVAVCGDAREPTLGEYSQQFAAIFEEVEERFEAKEKEFGLDDDSSPRVDLGEEQIEATRELLDAIASILRDALDQLEEIPPPAVVDQAHKELLDAGAELVTIIDGFTDRVVDVESASEFEELLDDSGLEAASDRFDQACFAVQDIVDDNGIDVDLRCEQE